MPRKKLPTNNVSRGEPPPAQPKRRAERTVTVLDFAAAVQQFVTQSDMAAICAALTESALYRPRFGVLPKRACRRMDGRRNAYRRDSFAGQLLTGVP